MFSYWADARDGLEVSRIVNNDMAEQVKYNPRRLVGLGTIPMQSPELAAPELERCMGELGLAGIEIGSHVDRSDDSEPMTLDDPKLFPIFKRCEELGAAVFIHPWDSALRWLTIPLAQTVVAIKFNSVRHHFGDSFDFSLHTLSQ